jgi:hypothetical protein
MAVKAHTRPARSVDQGGRVGMDTVSMKTCPFCAEEIEAEAVVCRFCGASVVGSPVSPLAPPPPPSSGPSAMPAGAVREGIVVSARQRFGFYSHPLVASLLLIVVFLGGGVSGFYWAETRSGLGFAKPAPVFYLGVIALVLVWALGVRDLGRTWRKLTSKAGLGGYRRALKEQYGFSLVLARRGLVGALVVTIVIWVGLEASAVYNLTSMGDEWLAKPGIYAAVVLPVLGVVAAALVWPTSRDRVVRMDAQGNILE